MSSHIAQTPSIVETPILAVSQLVGLALLAGVLSGSVALCYRWYTNERVQTGLPVLFGLSGVAAYLNTRAALGQVLTGTGGDPLSAMTALFNTTVFLIAGLTAVAAVPVGDRFGNDVFAAVGRRRVDGDVSRVVEAVGRALAVDLPEEIDDIVGYDPVPAETKAKIAGHTYLFPKRLTVGELETRLRTRLKDDYAVGHVDIEIAPDGSVEYLALGSRAAGIGPTLPPETVAVPIRADPAFAASAGDLVQVWRTDPAERVTTAELRGIAGDVVTLAVDAAEADEFDPDTRYRLVTLPVEPRADREFASLLRAASETMSVIHIQAGSPLLGQPLGSLSVAVIAIRADGGSVEPIPQRTRLIQAGDALYAVARPEDLRKLDAVAAPVQSRPPDVPAAATDDDD